MISDYLRRPIRDRLQVVRDMAVIHGYGWLELERTADKLEVMVALSKTGYRGSQVFARIGGDCVSVTGYTPSELVGEQTDVLQCPETDALAAKRFSMVLASQGEAETRLINRRKDGELYGCHLVACRAPKTLAPDASLLAFLCRCPIDQCR